MIHLKRLATGIVMIAAGAVAFSILAYVLIYWPNGLLIVLLLSLAYIIGGIFME